MSFETIGSSMEAPAGGAGGVENHMEESVYWIWLQSCLGVNCRSFVPAMKLYASAKEIYELEEQELYTSGIFSEREIGALLRKDLSKSREIADHCRKQQYQVIFWGSPSYPERLRSIEAPPIVLYVLGQLSEEEKLHCAMVGTRHPVQENLSVAFHLSQGLAREGAVIVSGGAVGIDYASHLGTCRADGTTLCVIGCGLSCYSSSFTPLILQEIPKKGAVISEYPPFFPAQKQCFPTRNRIISGLSDCMVVVQAGLASGSLIAAQYAIHQNRKLFAVPGPVFSERFAGSNLLLKNGFQPVLSEAEILRWYEAKKSFPHHERLDNPPSTAIMRRELKIRPEDLPELPRRSYAIDSLPPGLSALREVDRECRKPNDISFLSPFAFPDDSQPLSEEEKPAEAPAAPVSSEAFSAAPDASMNEEKGEDAPGELLTLEEEAALDQSGEAPGLFPKTSMLSPLFDRPAFDLQSALLEETDEEEANEDQLQKTPPLAEESAFLHNVTDGLSDLSTIPANAGAVASAPFQTGLISREGILKEAMALANEPSYQKDSLPRRLYTVILRRIAEKTDMLPPSFSEKLPQAYLTDEFYVIEHLRELYRYLGWNDSILTTYDIADLFSHQKDEQGREVVSHDAAQTMTVFPETYDDSSLPLEPVTGKKKRKTKKEQEGKKKTAEQLTGGARSVYDTISDTPVHFDIIAGTVDLPAGKVLSYLTSLELQGLIEKLPGSRYVRK